MKSRASLGRQLAFSMVGLSISTLLIAFIAIYATYWAILRYAPWLIGPLDSAIPSGTDLILLLVLSIFALAIGTHVAFRLAVRIVAPITQVAQAARRVARGDLTARAEAGERSFGEAAMLTGDFNAMAARLEKMAGDVTAWNAQIAHELRTPLTILRGRLQGVSDGVFVADAALMRGLTKQVDGLTRLVEDLRVVGLFDSGHLVLDLEEVDLAMEIEEVVRLVEPSFASTGFHFALDLDQGTGLVDPVRLRQAVMALIDNARKHAPPGRIGVFLECGPRAARIMIDDEGAGLPPDFTRHAFDAFTRVAGHGPSANGSGLGLMVVRVIMEAHGGSVAYDAVARRFVLTFPWAAVIP